MYKKLTVAQLNTYIKGVFEDELVLHDIELYGEVSQISIRNGSTYITLREQGQIINCARYDGVDDVVTGETITLKGTVIYLKNRSQVVFKYNTIKREGAGEYYARLNQLKQKLEAEGLFDEKNKAKLPKYVFCVGIITSGQGAAVHDFIKVLQQKAPFVKILIYSCKVQGEKADLEIIEGIKILNQRCPEIIVIARGGGAENDLSIFNSEALGRAVFASKVPVISAVGHEIDYTLCDFCACLRAGTPSIAADYIASMALRAYYDLKKLTNSVYGLIEKKLRLHQSYTKTLSKQMIFASQMAVSRSKVRIKTAANSMYKNVSSKAVLQKKTILNTAKAMKKPLILNVEFKKRQLQRLSGLLNALSPLKILSKGYCKVYKNDNAVSSIAQLEGGDLIDIRFSDGTKAAKVQ